MKAIIRRELRNFFKNPLYWVGLIIVLLSMYDNLGSYSKIHLFKDSYEIENLDKVRPTDADIMDGYIPTTESESIDIGLSEIKTTFIENFGMTEEEAELSIRDIKEQGFPIEETIRYLEEKYNFYDGLGVFMYAKQKKATDTEANAYIMEKLQEHPYSYYFSKKYADFASFHMALFSSVILAFLFITDMKKDIYELLHTKSISAISYVCGKFFGGFLALTIAVGINAIVFTIICQNNTLQEGVINNISNMFLATILYVMPTILIVTGIYTLIALLFKNPLPALPLILVYIFYSNMGTQNSLGTFEFRGKIFGVLFRFGDNFFETKVPTIFLFNQVAFVLLTILFIAISCQIWSRRRV